ncbi:hypothetical protein CEXT_743801 [Caerostris extrusa]|uniref:Uncharacterized protein n=1 Tax=Caerostris extrusa TaxID=172846 RepID=A0AAV4RMD0_CAEEX|nr:hypothetical protein CEXT_743801 [Caerostris extrusa]
MKFLVIFPKIAPQLVLKEGDDLRDVDHKESLPLDLKRSIHLEVGERYKAYWCVRNWFQPWLWRTYEVYMLLLILIAPSMIMGFAYTNICHQLWVVVKDRANMSCGEIPKKLLVSFFLA